MNAHLNRKMDYECRTTPGDVTPRKGVLTSTQILIMLRYNLNTELIVSNLIPDSVHHSWREHRQAERLLKSAVIYARRERKMAGRG